MKKILKYIKENWEKILVIALSAIALIIMYLFPILGEIKTLKENQNNINKRALRYEQNEYSYINLMTQELIDTSSSYYYNESNTQVNDTNYRTTPRIAVNGSISYYVGVETTSDMYITYYNANVVRLSTTKLTNNGFFTTPSNARYIRFGCLASAINRSWLYQGQIAYNYYLPNPDILTNDYYNSGYDNGYEASLLNIFTYSSFENMPVLAILEDNNIINLDSTDYTYDPTLFFKNNYVDLQYLRSLNINTSRYFIFWADSDYLLSDLNLSISGSTNNYNILVNNRAFVIGLNSVFIDSSDLLEMISFDSLFLDNTRLTNHSIMFSQGFNKGFNTGYDFGYNDGQIETEDYYDELIIPQVKIEYEEIGYNNGYDVGYDAGYDNGYDVGEYDGYSQGLADGAEDFGILGFLRNIFKVITDVLSVEILPKIKMIYIVSIPLVLSVVKFVLGLFR